MDMNRPRLESGGESINSLGADPASLELESDASTASLPQQQQQRKLWRSKSTVRSELSVEAANNTVTNEELKELKQWFQVIKPALRKMILNVTNPPVPWRRLSWTNVFLLGGM